MSSSESLPSKSSITTIRPSPPIDKHTITYGGTVELHRWCMEGEVEEGRSEEYIRSSLRRRIHQVHTKLTSDQLTSAVDHVFEEANVTMNYHQKDAELATRNTAKAAVADANMKARIKKFEEMHRLPEQTAREGKEAKTERERKDQALLTKLSGGIPYTYNSTCSQSISSTGDRSTAEKSLTATLNAATINPTTETMVLDIASTPTHTTNTTTLPVNPTKAAHSTSTKKPIDPLEAVRQRIVSLEAGTPLSKSISKRDPLAIDRKKRTKSRQKPYICPGAELCKSLLCAHEADNARQEQERLGQLVAVVKKKFQDLEKKGLSSAYVNTMLIENHDALVPTINGIKADFLKRTTTLTSTGRLTLSEDPDIRRYSYSELLGRNLYLHFDVPSTVDYDIYLAGVEKHQPRLLDLAANGKQSHYAMDIKKCKKNPRAGKGVLVLYEIEARLMDERALVFEQAKERGEEGDILAESLRRFDKSIWNLEWLKEKIESVFALTEKDIAKSQPDVSSGLESSHFDNTGVNLGEASFTGDGSNADDQDCDTAAHDAEPVMTEEEVMELIQSETQARDDYTFSCMAGEMELEGLLSNMGPFDESTPDEAIKRLMKEDKNRNDSKTKKLSRATIQYQRQQEQKRLEQERMQKICELTQMNVKKQYEMLKAMEMRELTAANIEDEAAKKFVAEGWKEFCLENLTTVEKTQTV